MTRTDTSGYEGPALFIFDTPNRIGTFEATCAVTAGGRADTAAEDP